MRDNHRFNKLARQILPVILSALCLCSATLHAETDQNAIWENGLRKLNFSDRPIIESDEVIKLTAPQRADDGSIVPIKILAQIPQTKERYIKTITLLIDKNPIPTAGKFHFTPRSGRADLALRIRLNEYSTVRAIAEMNDGNLYMTSQFVKASGGCSAPVGTDLETAMARLGKIRFRTDADTALSSPVATQLAISHPNITGLQMNQITRNYEPALFVKKINVSFAGEEIFSAETDISVSENPNFRFYFVPEHKGELRAIIVDSAGQKFTQSYDIGSDKAQNVANEDGKDS